MVTTDMENLDNAEYDKVLNEIANGVFTPDSETDRRQVQIMLWGLCNLLLDKGFITREELDKSTQSATAFFKLLKRRYDLQNADNTDDSTENS